MKKNNKIIYIILGIILVILLIQPGGIMKTQDNIQNIINQVSNSGSGNSGITNENNNFGVSIGLYDKNGNKITPNKGTFSIVGTTPGVSDIDFTITVPNTGSYALSCDLVSLSPTPLNNAVTKTTKQIQIGGKTAWTSSKIPVAQFESTTSTNFNATVRCSYNPGSGVTYLPDKVGSISLSIKSESSGASFEVEIDTGGVTDEYCGDGVCQVTETSSTCPGDCAVANNVKFRTTDLSYVSGSAVGYSNTCGNILTKYGKTTGACTTHFCDATDQLLLVPSSSGTTKLWIDGSDICICDVGVTSHTYSKRYSTSDSDASKIDNSFISFDAAKEVSC